MYIKMNYREVLKVNQYQEFLCSLKGRLTEEEQVLRESDRADEADFVRIRLNICDVADTIYNVFSKQGAGFEKAYAERLAQMRLGWESKKENAQLHGDVRAALIEELKAETMLEIEKKFEQLTS